MTPSECLWILLTYQRAHTISARTLQTAASYYRDAGHTPVASGVPARPARFNSEICISCPYMYRLAGD